MPSDSASGVDFFPPSMKVPPKRKGNRDNRAERRGIRTTLNESPSEKEGKFWARLARTAKCISLNESPSEKEGK